MDNPWSELPMIPSYVIPADRPHIEAFNDLFGGGDGNCRLDLDLFPEPFIGRRDANLVILALNPGKSPGDFEAHQDPRFLAVMRAKLMDDPAVHLFTGLLDEWQDTPAGKW
jgi:hypothetical protein